jgi:hypothetical protein
MCILIATLGGVPTRKALERSCCANPDGFGFAILYEDGELFLRKGMESAPIISSYLARMNGKRTVTASLFHARIGTSGKKDTDNCHPFFWGNDGQTVLAHNGILRDIKDTETESDTRVFAGRVLPQIGDVTQLDSPFMFFLLEKFLGQGNKVAVLTASADALSPLYILNEDRGDWDGDTRVWYSNDTWKEPTPYTATPYTGTPYTWDNARPISYSTANWDHVRKIDNPSTRGGIYVLWEKEKPSRWEYPRGVSPLPALRAATNTGQVDPKGISPAAIRARGAGLKNQSGVTTISDVLADLPANYTAEQLDAALAFWESDDEYDEDFLEIIVPEVCSICDSTDVTNLAICNDCGSCVLCGMTVCACTSLPYGVERSDEERNELLAQLREEVRGCIEVGEPVPTETRDLIDYLVYTDGGF